MKKFLFYFAILQFVFSVLFVSCRPSSEVEKLGKPDEIILSDTLFEYDFFDDIKGKLFKIDAIVKMKDGSINRNISWELTPSENVKIYSASDGRIEFEILQAGTYTIIASYTANGIVLKKASCVINAPEDGYEPESITISSTLMQYDSFSEIKSRKLELEASVTQKNGELNKDIQWDIPTDTSAFKMHSSSNGKLIFEILKPGTYTVTASCSYDDTLNYKQVSCIIKTKDELTDLYIYNYTAKYGYTEGSTISLAKDDSIILAVGYYPEGTPQKNVMWSLEPTDIASIDINQKTGLVTLKGLSNGTATLTLSSLDKENISTSLRISVKDSYSVQSVVPSIITLAVPKPTVEIGKTSQVNATVKDSHGNIITDGTVEFSLDNNAAKAFSVKINSSRVATVTAVKDGAGYLTATYKFTGSDGKESSITAKGYLSASE